MFALVFVLATASLFFMNATVAENLMLASVDYFFSFIFFGVFVAGFFKRTP